MSARGGKERGKECHVCERGGKEREKECHVRESAEKARRLWQILTSFRKTRPWLYGARGQVGVKIDALALFVMHGSSSFTIVEFAHFGRKMLQIFALLLYN